LLGRRLGGRGLLDEELLHEQVIIRLVDCLHLVLILRLLLLLLLGLDGRCNALRILSVILSLGLGLDGGNCGWLWLVLEHLLHVRVGGLGGCQSLHVAHLLKIGLLSLELGILLVLKLLLHALICLIVRLHLHCLRIVGVCLLNLGCQLIKKLVVLAAELQCRLLARLMGNYVACRLLGVLKREASGVLLMGMVGLGSVVRVHLELVRCLSGVLGLLLDLWLVILLRLLLLLLHSLTVLLLGLLLMLLQLELHLELVQILRVLTQLRIVFLLLIKLTRMGARSLRLGELFYLSSGLLVGVALLVGGIYRGSKFLSTLAKSIGGSLNL
jgi:hypothetical protein